MQGGSSRLRAAPVVTAAGWAALVTVRLALGSGRGEDIYGGRCCWPPGPMATLTSAMTSEQRSKCRRSFLSDACSFCGLAERGNGLRWLPFRCEFRDSVGIQSTAETIHSPTPFLQAIRSFSFSNVEMGFWDARQNVRYAARQQDEYCMSCNFWLGSPWGIVLKASPTQFFKEGKARAGYEARRRHRSRRLGDRQRKAQAWWPQVIISSLVAGTYSLGRAVQKGLVCSVLHRGSGAAASYISRMLSTHPVHRAPTAAAAARPTRTAAVAGAGATALSAASSSHRPHSPRPQP